jgi:hypothetical protein
MWGTSRRLARPVIALSIGAAFISACATPLWVSPSSQAVELTTGPAAVWLTSDPSSPDSPVDVAMTAPDRGDIHFAHRFEAGAPLRGVFATSRGRYVLSAMGGSCSLPLTLGASDEAQVRLTIAPGATCTLAVTWQGNAEGAGYPRHGDGVLITNNNVDAGTPRSEGQPSASDGR